MYYEPSFAQRRLWFMDRFAPGLSAYNVANIINIKGQFTETRLRSALLLLANRHDAFRSCFIDEDGRPLVQVNEQILLPLAITDLIDIEDESERLEKAAQLARSLAEPPFNLDKAPLFRMHWLKLGAEEHQFVYVVHHIISDRWSLSIFINELCSLLASEAGKDEQALLESTLDPLPLNYATHATRQQGQFNTETYAPALDFFLDLLGSGPHVLELPTDYPRQKFQQYRGDVVPLLIDSELTEQIHNFARSRRMTPFIVLISVYQILLARYSGELTPIVGTFLAGRTEKDVEGLVGLFVNTMALRFDLSENPSFEEVLLQTRKLLLRSHPHQSLPYELVVDALTTKRDTSRTPIAQVAFNFHNVPAPQTDFGSLKVELKELHAGGSRYDLTLTLRPSNNQIEGEFEFCTDLFTQARIQRMVAHFVRLLRAVLNDPGCAVTKLPLVSTTEWQSLQENFRSAEKTSKASIIDRIRTQASRTPDQDAIRFENNRLTYSELVKRIDTATQFLIGEGITSSDTKVVGLCMERSDRMLVAMLSIMQAGYGYLPLDPALPPQRLAYYLKDSGASIVVAEEGTFNVLDGIDSRLIDFNRLENSADIAHPEYAVKPSQLAYMIYTSGSTGKPKGVSVLQHHIVSSLDDIAKRLNLKAGFSLLAIATVSFDISVLELIMPLFTGGCTVIAPRSTALNSHRLIEALHNIDVLQATPATFRMLVDGGYQPRESLTLLCGGETLNRELATTLITGGSTLWNLYGTTESTLWSTAQLVFPAEGLVPIGIPLDSEYIYVVDASGQPLPPGIVGELWIGGSGITNGYHNRPELTAKHFIPDPWREDSTSVCYSTGDLVWQHEDGTLEFVGRLDNQIKLNGYRIELGEVETGLINFDQIDHAIVEVHGKGSNARLIAYCTQVSDLHIDTNTILTELSKILPSHMVPSMILVLDTMPLNPNGKVDRNKLPPPPIIGNVTTETRRPRDDFELRLSRLWERILDVSEVGLDDDFFKLGGNSLLAIMMLSAVETEFGKQLELPSLFSSSTLVELAAQLKSDTAVKQSSVLALKEGNTHYPLFLFRGLFIYDQLAQQLNEEQSCYALYLDEEVNSLLSSERTVQKMAQLYVDAITTTNPKGPYILAGLSYGGVLALESAHQLQQAGHEVKLVVLIDTILPTITSFHPLHWIFHHLRLVQNLGLSGYFKQSNNPLIQWARKTNNSHNKVSNADLGDKDYIPVKPGMLAVSGLQILRQAMKSYTPPNYTGNVLLLKAEEHTRHPGYALAEDLGWSKHIKGQLDIHSVSGDHLTMIKIPHVEAVVQHIENTLASQDELTN